MRSGLTSLVALAFACACAETGRDRILVPLFVAGTQTSETVLAVGGIPVSIERADLAFGPLYLCAGATAGDLCDTAVLEWLDTIVIDTTDPTPVRAGVLAGVSGPVRSWMYDLAISSQLTRSQPFVLEAAKQLDGASFVIEGRANLSGSEIAFRAVVPVHQTDDTELGVPVVRKSTSERFFRDVAGGESGLVVRFDPTLWVPSLDFRELGQSCSPGQGCGDALALGPDTQPFRALRNALVSGRGPSFDWGFVP